MAPSNGAWLSNGEKNGLGAQGEFVVLSRLGCSWPLWLHIRDAGEFGPRAARFTGLLRAPLRPDDPTRMQRGPIHLPLRVGACRRALRVRRSCRSRSPRTNGPLTSGQTNLSVKNGPAHRFRVRRNGGAPSKRISRICALIRAMDYGAMAARARDSGHDSC